MCTGGISWIYNGHTLFHEMRNQGIDMRRVLIAALTIAGLGIGLTPEAQAQAYRSGVGWNGGILVNTSLNDGATGTELVDMKPDATWTVGVHYDQWFGSGNVGVRARGTFSKPTLPWVQGDREIRVYTADLGLMLRPMAPEAGRTVLPFISGGVGVTNWGLGDGPATTFDPAGVVYGGEEGFDLVAAAGVGFDIITPWRWGDGPLVVRLEALDHVQLSSPFEPVNPDDGDFGLIHNAAVVLGIYTGVGILGGNR
jgi:hypothetical protein